jgi:hypothetical protein
MRPSSTEAFAAKLFPLESASSSTGTDARPEPSLGNLPDLVASVGKYRWLGKWMKSSYG